VIAGRECLALLAIGAVLSLVFLAVLQSFLGVHRSSPAPAGFGGSWSGALLVSFGAALGVLVVAFYVC